jgi:hypothetical protein
MPTYTERLVDAALRNEVRGRADGELVGLSCIADGADTLFARAVLDAGGELVVIVPAEQYRAGLPAEHHPHLRRADGPRRRRTNDSTVPACHLHE